MKKISTLLAALFVSVAVFAQFSPRQLVTWTTSVEATPEKDIYKVIFTGKIEEGYHTYTLADEFSATEFIDVTTTSCELSGKPYELSTPKEEVDAFGEMGKHYYNEIILAQDVKVTGKNASISGTIFTNSCTDSACQPEYNDFEVKIEASAAPAE